MHAIKSTKTVAFILVLILSFSFVNVNAQSNNKKVILGGTPFGLKLFTNGVIVIEVNENKSPADAAGIEVNDLITKVNQEDVTSNETLKSFIENSNGEPLKLEIIRNGMEISKTIIPQKDDNNNYVAGMWIRDSTAGIGTVTYFDYENKTFGALGHGICDKDTGMLMPLRNGEIMSATISNYQKAQDGVIGGLNGYFDSKVIGSITANNGYGIYGTYEHTDNTTIVEVANNQEISEGKATILTTIEENKTEEFDVEIIKVAINENNGQNMIIKVTDEELLNKTGGIVQGMSGSPILQNGKLVGAVTHVFINSPEKGYGIAISNMLCNN